MVLEMRDIDRRVWEEELEEFLPGRIFDAHTHIHLRELDRTETGPDDTTRPFPRIDHEVLSEMYGQLFPGREVHSLLFGWVFEKPDFDSLNAFVAEQAAFDPMAVPFMLTPPTFSPEHLAEQVDKKKFRGLKPYPFWTEKRWEAAITDIIPEPLLEVADEKRLFITLHLSKKTGIADAGNIQQLNTLSRRYPGVRWILPHAARASVVWPLERGIDGIRDLPNLWYDTSSVTDPEVYSLLFRKVGMNRILYGSDISSDLIRGQMVGFGFAWALLTEDVIAGMNITHCDPASTFVLYETLRAARRAMIRDEISRENIEDIFFRNAVRLFDLPAD